MKRLLALLVPLIALTGCASYGDGYYRDRTVYQDGGYYYPAYEGDGDYYYGADDGYDYDYDYPYSGGIGYGYGYSPFAGLDRYRCRSYYGCVPSWGGYYPHQYAPGWSFSVGNTWGWSNWGWYNGYRWNDRPHYRDRDRDHDRNQRPDYPYYGNEDNYERWPRPMPKPHPDNYPSSRAPASAVRPGTPVAPTRRPVVGGERARDQGEPMPRDYRKPAVRPQPAVRPGTYPAPRAVGGERSLQPVRRASVPVQPAPARYGGTRMRYPEPVRAQPRQPVGEPAPMVRQSQGASYSRPMPQARPAVQQARPAPLPRATPMAKPAPRQASPAPRPAPRPQVRPTSQNSTSDDEP